MTSDFYGQLYRLNLGNVMLLYGLVACAIYERKPKDPEVGQLVERVRHEGGLESIEVQQITHRLLDRAFKGKLKGGDDAYARLLSTAVSIYQKTTEIEEEEDLPVMWCMTWLDMIMAIMVRDPKEIETKMLNAVTQFEVDFLSTDPLPHTTQRAILGGFARA